jgi:hypothetical protein
MHVSLDYMYTMYIYVCTIQYVIYHPQWVGLKKETKKERRRRQKKIETRLIAVGSVFVTKGVGLAAVTHHPDLDVADPVVVTDQEHGSCVQRSSMVK